MISDPAQFEKSEVQLPRDFLRSPSAPPRPQRHSFELSPLSGGAVVDAPFAAAFAILLSRYSSQTEVTLNASRLGSNGALLWRRPLTLSTTMEASGRNVLDQAQALVRRFDAQEGEGEPADRRSLSSRAGIAFMESDPTEELLDQDELLFAVRMSGGKMRATFFYDAGVFKRSSVERFAGQLSELSAHLFEAPDAPLSRLRLLPEAERRWIESVCEGRPRRSPAEPAHRSFERHAAVQPSATAVRFRESSLTYGELNSRANRLARYWASAGVGTESRVVVCLEPSLDIAVVLLSILKTGAVYVPLEPSYPVARIRAILDDIQPKVIVTRAHLREKIAGPEFPIFLMEDAEASTNSFSDENLNLPVEPDQTAYIYYTSGTTGMPKGAMASQANLASYIRSAQERYAIGSSDVMPAIARFNFSISMFELMSPLAAGGTLIVLERDHILDPARMSRTLSEVTIFHAGPSLLKNILPYIKRQYLDFGAFSCVRHASSGGDMVAPEVLEDLKLIFSNAEVFVIYGCSEISCMGCTYPVSRDRAVERTYVGRPFDGMAVRVLDAARNPLPAGAVGEIHFAGDGVVKGYWNRPELTSEKFIKIDGRRFYRTGDMGRLSEDGWLEILGRSDFQVKVRGMRIELGEVEHHLRRAPGVRDAVVASRRTNGDENPLVAYLVMQSPNSSPAAAVCRYLAQHLPDYMIPATYVELDRLPLNHNMKVDRRALPEPEEADRRLDGGVGLREPATETEKRLAAIWRKLLGVGKIGRDDHFFELGGHSLLGLTLMSEIKSEWGVALEGIDVLMESLMGQAALCDQRLGRGGAAAAAVSGSGIPPAAPDNDFEAFHFGKERDLYGVLHAPRRQTREAVLICSSIGQEQVRAHFVLRRLAKRLADRGVPAMRFDYYGWGDSLGEGIAATCGRWQCDIEEAYEELRRRTGATGITAVGVRLGAALLGGMAGRLEFDKLVLWDPVCDGARYFTEISETHKKYVHSLRQWRFRGKPASLEGATELLGLTCSEANALELKALAFRLDSIRERVPIKWLATSQVRAQARAFRRIAGHREGSRMEAIDFETAAYDYRRLDHNLPDIGISAMLATMATERS